MVTTVPITTANSSVKVTLIPSIVTPCTVEEISSTPGIWTFTNAAFGGTVIQSCTSTTIQNIITAMSRSIEFYRITSQSATVELIAPSLTDQGTITAAQYRVAPRTYEFYSLDSQNVSLSTYPDVEEWPDSLSTASLILGTSAYTSKAREGAYMPLKLTSFKWRNFSDRTSIVCAATNRVSPYGTQYFVSSNLHFPYGEVRGSGIRVQDVAVPKFCGSNVGIIDLGGLAANVAVRVRVRQVVELTALPSSTYAPLVECALPPDETALRMYEEISSRMADAYPASYNDLGTLFEKIKEIGKSVLPFVDPALDMLSKMPVIGGVASAVKTAVPAITGVVQAAKKTAKAKKAPKASSKPARPPK